MAALLATSISTAIAGKGQGASPSRGGGLKATGGRLRQEESSERLRGVDGDAPGPRQVEWEAR